nr:hypothetical protein [Tanacetum cinerariifolium]
MSSAIFLVVASLFFWQWKPSSLAVGTSSASRNSIPGSGNALCILFPTIDVIKTINIELEHSVAKLLTENEHLNKEIEHLKKTYKDLYDFIKKTRVQTKDRNDSLIAQLNKKSIENADLKAQIQKKVFANAALKNKLRKLIGNSVDTKFAKPSILGKPLLQSLRNQSVVRQPAAFKSERSKISKPRNSLKNMPRFSSNDMVYNRYLEEAKKKTQERDRNSKTSVMPSTRLQNTDRELESLFGPLFDEYFNRENQVVSKFSVVTTADASDKRQQQSDSALSTSTLGPIVTADGNFDL